MTSSFRIEPNRNHAMQQPLPTAVNHDPAATVHQLAIELNLSAAHLLNNHNNGYEAIWIRQFAEVESERAVAILQGIFTRPDEPVSVLPLRASAHGAETVLNVKNVLQNAISLYNGNLNALVTAEEVMGAFPEPPLLIKTPDGLYQVRQRELELIGLLHLTGDPQFVQPNVGDDRQTMQDIHDQWRDDPMDLNPEVLLDQ